MGKQIVSDEVKAAALADLATGEQPAVVARRYGLNRQTVKGWKTKVVEELQPVVEPDNRLQRQPIVYPAVEERYLTLAELVEQSLRAKLIAVQRLAEHATNDEWLQRQTAADVAELFESLDRSAVGILDRLAAAHRPAADAE